MAELWPATSRVVAIFWEGAELSLSFLQLAELPISCLRRAELSLPFRRRGRQFDSNFKSPQVISAARSAKGPP
eukprot:8654661-Pyramimonas_sp.AAC.1